MHPFIKSTSNGVNLFSRNNWSSHEFIETTKCKVKHIERFFSEQTLSKLIKTSRDLFRDQCITHK